VRNFEYIKVSTLDEAVRLLRTYGTRAQILAGGTDLLVKLKQKQIVPEVLIDIKGIPNLDGIEYQKDTGMRIGALTTIREIELSPVIRKYLPVLAYAASLLGSVQIRHRATIGGNLCNALPSADMGPYLIGMGSKAVATSSSGERTLEVERLFASSGQNSLNPGEIVTMIDIPVWSKRLGGAYIKHTMKRAVDVAMVCVATVVEMDPLEEVFRKARIVLGAVGAVPIRPKIAEEYLRGRVARKEVIADAAQLASEEAKPRTLTEYKKEMVRVLTKRALNEALERALTAGFERERR